MKVWFLTCQMPVLSGRINFDPFLKTWKFFAPKFPMKYSKNGQNFTTPKNTKNGIFETCWTPGKKPHFSKRPRSRNTFFWLTPYQWPHLSQSFWLIDRLIGWSIDGLTDWSIQLVNLPPTFLLFCGSWRKDWCCCQESASGILHQT